VEKVFIDQQVSAAGGGSVQLNTNKNFAPRRGVHWIDFRIDITLPNATENPINFDPYTFFRNSSLSTWYNDNTPWVNGVPLYYFDIWESIVEDSLVLTPQSTQGAVAIAPGGTTTSYYLRLPCVLQNARRPRDLMLSLAELGNINLTFPATDGTTATGVVRVTAYAMTEWCKTVPLAVRQRIDWLSGTGNQIDTFPLHGKLHMFIVGNDDSNVAMNAATGAIVKIDNEIAVDGLLLGPIDNIVKDRGAIEHRPSVARQLYINTAFVPLYHAPWGFSMFDLPYGDKLQVVYTSQTVPNGKIQYVTHVFYKNQAGCFRTRLPICRDLTRATMLSSIVRKRNTATNGVSEINLAWLPAEFDNETTPGRNPGPGCATPEHKSGCGCD
jgi:hypothetical protein